MRNSSSSAESAASPTVSADCSVEYKSAGLAEMVARAIYEVNPLMDQGVDLDGHPTSAAYAVGWESLADYDPGIRDALMEQARAAINITTQHVMSNVAWWEGVYEDRPLSKEAIVAELSDFRMVMAEVPKVYVHATGGLLSKPNYRAEEVISAIDDHITSTVDEETNDLRCAMRGLLSALDECGWRRDLALSTASYAVLDPYIRRARAIVGSDQSARNASDAAQVPDAVPGSAQNV